MVRARGLRLARIVIALLVTTVVMAPAVGAAFDPGALPAGSSTQADLVIEGTGPGRGFISGALAPSQFDPLNGYPLIPPMGSVPKTVRFAGLITAEPVPHGPDLRLYCIDITMPTSPGVRYELGTWNEAAVPNVGYIARLLNTYYPNTNEPAALLDPDDKAAAVQSAIWFFSDKYVLGAFQPRRATVAAIVQNVINLGPLVDPAPPSLSITPTTAEGPAASLIGPFTISTSNPATVTASSGRLFLDASGSQPLTNPVSDGTQFWARRALPGPIDIEATAEAVVPSGNAYLPLGQAAQKLILAQTGTVRTSVSALATAFDVGNLRVVKSVSGLGEPMRSAVAIAVTCTDHTTGSIVYPAGSPPTPLLVANIRAGSVCTVIELVDGANGLVSVTTTFTPGNTVTIPTNNTTTDTTNVDVSNIYDVRTGSLRITKAIAGSEASQRGDVVVDVSCSDGTTAALTFPAGIPPQPRTVPDLPAGTTCTTTESVDGGNPPTVNVSTTIDPPGPVTIQAGETAEVTVFNLYDGGVGSLAVVKATKGLDELRGPVTIRAECTDGSVGEQTYPPGSTRPPLVLENLPFGTQCTVSEPADGETGLVGVTTTIAPASTVTIGAPQPPVIVRITNTYTPKPGDVTVEKTVVGEGSALHGRIVVVAACEDGQIREVAIPAGAPGPASATITGVPAGDDCGVAELADGANSAVSVSVSGLPDGLFVVLPAVQRTLSIVNDYRLNPGALLVTKEVDGPEAAGRGPITLAIACSNGTQASRTFDPGSALEPILLDEVPAGTTCRIEEPANGAVPGIGAVTSGAPRTLTIAPGTTASAVVRNTYVDVEVLGATAMPGGLPRTGTDPKLVGAVGLLVLLLGFAALAGASVFVGATEDNNDYR